MNTLSKNTRLLRQRSLPRLLLILWAVLIIALSAIAIYDKAMAEQPTWSWIYLTLSTMIFIFAYTPLIGGVWTAGMLPTAILGGVGIIISLFRKVIFADRLLTAFVIVFYALFFTLIIVCIPITLKMLRVSKNSVPENSDDITAVVLGCRIKGDQPSKMLSERLKCAADYLNRHPSAICIVSGGQGADEPMPEAIVMQRYLIELGIPPHRILTEPDSASTYENIFFSLELMKQSSLSSEMAIVSDRFHQYRAACIANRLGVTAYAVNRRTSWYLTIPYWIREIFGVLLMHNKLS